MQIQTAQRSPFPTYDRMLTIGDASTMTGLSYWTLKRRAAAGELKILKLSPRRLGIRLSELNRFLDAREIRV